VTALFYELKLGSFDLLAAPPNHPPRLFTPSHLSHAA
jgi:hypothetical protein